MSDTLGYLHDHYLRTCRFMTRAALLVLVLASIIAGNGLAVAAEDSGYVTIRTARGSDTLVQGLHEYIRAEFRLGNASDTLAGFDLLLITQFSGSNTIGPLYDTGLAPNVIFSDFIQATWPIAGWDPYYGNQVTSPDTVATSAGDFNYNPPWMGDDLLFEICVSPSDTGTFRIAPAAPIDTWSAFGTPSEGLPFKWTAPTFQVIPCTASGLVWGDAQYDGLVSSSDIIFLVNHVFKSGGKPVILELGDNDCSGVITTSDIIGLVNYVFKSGDEPCDPCSVNLPE